MKKLIIALFTLASLSAFAKSLPVPAGSMADAKKSLCDGKKLPQVMEAYVDTIMALTGVQGMGQSVLLPNENPFKIRCSHITIYAETANIKDIQMKVGETLEGHIVEVYEGGGAGHL